MQSEKAFKYLLCIQVIGSIYAISPYDFAKRSSERVIQDKDTFFHWEYGGAIIMDALYSYNDVFQFDYTPLLDTYLSKFKEDTNSYGYKLLHNKSIPFDSAVGDGIGLFPINYLRRAWNHPKDPKSKTDMDIVNTVANNFILGWPYRLKDGTFSRHHGWTGEVDKNASFLWGDDQFMGLTLLTRLANVNSDANSIIEFVAKQAIQFAEHMMDKKDGLFFHGYNDADGKESCCKWGRANGWGMMAHVEILEVLNTFKGRIDPALNDKLAEILSKHSAALAKVQSDDGRWHQVLDEPSTFLETSATAMFISTMVRGVFGGWLKKDDYDSVIRKAWDGLQKTLQKDGTISGITMGTGIYTNVDDYQKRPTLYPLSAPGLGSVLYAAREMFIYTSHGFN